MSGPADDVAGMTAVELLRDLAETLRSCRWFDTDEGERYAEAVRPRLMAFAAQLEELTAMMSTGKPPDA
jgi:hypothetical protein